MKSKFSLILTILFALVIVQMTFAAEGESAAAKPTKDELGMWWNKSSLTYSPMVTNYLVHTEITYSYTQYEGNLQGHAQDGRMLVALRKNRLTYYHFGELSKKSYKVYVTQSEMNLNDDMFDNVLRFDALKNIYVDLGHRFEDNTERLLKERTDIYAGLGGYYDKPRLFNVSMFVGGGNETIVYDKMVPINARESDDPIMLLVHNGTANIGPALTFAERVTFRQRFNDFDDDYDLAVKAMLTLWFSSNISVSYRYEMDHYNRAFPIAKKTDVQHVYGLTLNLDLRI
jgi:hypothetical protein